MMQTATRQELLITCVARLLTGLHHVAVGASSPIPAAGAMLVRAQDEAAGRTPLRVSILGSEANQSTNSVERLRVVEFDGHRRTRDGEVAMAPGELVAAVTGRAA